MIRSFALLAWASCLALPCAAAVPRVLFIGNSLTAGNDVPGKVQELAAAIGQPIEVELRAYGNYSLQEHLAEPGLDAVLARGWDVLVLQQGPSSTPANRLHLRRHVQAMVHRAGSHVDRIALFAPWPRQQHLHTSSDALRSYREAAAAVGGCVLPVVSAWGHQLPQAGIASLYERDGLHATRAGSLLAALTIVRGLVGVPRTTPGPQAGLDASAAAAYTGHGTECTPPHPADPAAAVLPSEGYWTAADAPGSGLFLEIRGQVAGVALFGYQPGGDGPAPGRWWVGSGRREGARLQATLHAFSRPCSECAAEPQESRVLEIQFESSRRAFLALDGAPPLAVRALAFGGSHAPLPDSVDTVWGPLPLPDLSGEWLLASIGPDGADSVQRVHFDALDGSGGTTFASEVGVLDCSAATGSRRAGCRFAPHRPASDGINRPWWLALGNITEGRFHGRSAGNGSRPILGLRVAPAATGEPVEGLWWDPLRPGSGFALARRPSVLALTVFDYDAHGRSRWRNATGPWLDGQLDAVAIAFRGGGCWGCAAPAPVVIDAQASALRLEASGARTATLEIAPQPATAVASMAYGTRYMDTRFVQQATPLPDLSGTWLLSAPDAGVAAAIVTLAEAQPRNDALVFSGTLGADDEPVTVDCGPRVDAPACTLMLDGLVLDFPLAWMGEDRLTGLVPDHSTGAVLVRLPAIE